MKNIEIAWKPGFQGELGKNSQKHIRAVGMQSRNMQGILEGPGLFLIRNDLQLAYASEVFFSQWLSLSGAGLPLVKHGPLNQRQPHLSLVPSIPLVTPHCFGLLFPSRPKPRAQAHRANHSQGKRKSKREKTAEFSVFFCRRKQGYFWPLSVKSDFFFFLEAQCLAGFRQGSGNESPHFEYLCIFALCQFCLSSSAWLSPVSLDCWLLSNAALKPKKVKPGPHVQGWGALVRGKERIEKKPSPTLDLAVQLKVQPHLQFLLLPRG